MNLFEDLKTIKLERLTKTDLTKNFDNFEACEGLWMQDEYSTLDFIKSSFERCHNILKQTRDIDDEYTKWDNIESILKNGKVVSDMFNYYRVVSDCKKCPICGSSIQSGLEAYSRRDNYTCICSDCGEKEALEDLIHSRGD